MKAKLTKKFVEQLEAKDGKPVIVFDTELAGFAIKVSPAGRRSYQLRYRMGGRSTPVKTFTIGRHGQLTVHQARRHAQILLGDIKRGIDPAAEKAKRAAEERGALSVEVLSRQFLESHGRTKLRPRSLEEYRRAFQQHINPRLGALKVRDVTHGDVERLHHEMRATPPTANRTIAALSKFFSWAIRGGYRPDRNNPCHGLEKYKETPRKRYLSSDEIVRLGAATFQLEAKEELNAWQAAFFRILLLTGMRRDELRCLQWRRVNFERGVMILEELHSKTGARDVDMHPRVGAELLQLPRIAGNPHVFCGKKPGAPMVNVAKPWRRLICAAGIDPARVHDLRHTAGSVGVALGASLPLIGGVLGHKNAATTERYAHLSDDPVRATSFAIADQVAMSLYEDVDQAPPRKKK